MQNSGSYPALTLWQRARLACRIIADRRMTEERVAKAILSHTQTHRGPTQSETIVRLRRERDEACERLTASRAARLVAEDERDEARETELTAVVDYITRHAGDLHGLTIADKLEAGEHHRSNT